MMMADAMYKPNNFAGNKTTCIKRGDVNTGEAHLNMLS